MWMAPEVERGDGIVFVTERARFPFEFWARDTAIVDETVPVYPAAAWGDYRTGDQPPTQPCRTTGRPVRRSPPVPIASGWSRRITIAVWQRPT
ncbi:MAG: hypothetical protein M5T61_02095 [Acidimicrobiia bacterium]|nr:hypothetical protein [Acidimicrobiia bacterium]